jgi:small subunit ribosomal protein S3|uniref:ribosomal protein S3 n=1 Tax=Tetraselmis suecica TaxID=270643 RepID=UPI0021D52CBF|nr:ribosomal protein S3 [Tetraselmis suecica]UXF58496.1 ribosomal protein S3 [Tetraselmis suecica]
MGQKVHPVGFRLGTTKTHKSTWFTDPKIYPIFVAQDQFLRKTLMKKYKDAGISNIEINRKVNQVFLTLRTSKPDIILEKENAEIKLNELRKELDQLLHKYTIQNILSQKKYAFFEKIYFENGKSTQINVHITKLANPNADVHFIGDFLVEKLEQRVIFRRAIRQAIKLAQRQNVEGIKIQISGRLNGAEIARSEWVREGRVPLQTLRADIDYTYTTAKTIYGVLGIKIWIFLGNTSKKF